MAEPLLMAQAGLSLGSAITGIFGGFGKKKQAKKVRRETLRQKDLGLMRMDVEASIGEQERLAALRQNNLARLQQSKEARVRQAEILASAVGAGAGTGSSGVQGATSAVASNLGFNLGLITSTEQNAQDRFDRMKQIDAINREILESQQQAARAANKAGQIGATVGMIQSSFGAAGSIMSMFGTPGGAGSGGTNVSDLFNLA